MALITIFSIGVFLILDQKIAVAKKAGKN